MSAAQKISNKATLERLHHALDGGDDALISTTVDEIFHPDVRIGTPLPIEARGAQALSGRCPYRQVRHLRRDVHRSFADGRIVETWGVVDPAVPAEAAGIQVSLWCSPAEGPNTAQAA